MNNPPLILVVEDNISSADILKTRLTANDYQVVVATDGVEGVHQVKLLQPDLILSDIMMPKMDGLQFCQTIRADPQIPFIPIIFITAKADVADVVAGLEAGGDEYLTKPVDHVSLMARVKSMLRIKDLHDKTLAQANQLKLQLETASKVQSLFLPKSNVVHSGADIWTHSEPASYVGGDLYDIIPMPNDSLLIYVADIAGKGVPAALLMAALSTMIRAEAPLHDDLSRLIQVINNSMVNLVWDEGYFATMVCARYWPGSGHLQFIRAGHPYPLWISRGKSKQLPGVKGVPLGISQDITYTVGSIILSPGESCIFYSDGLLEAENDQQIMFGEKNLTACLARKQNQPWGNAILEAVREWRNGVPINDDTTLLEISHH